MVALTKTKQKLQVRRKLSYKDVQILFLTYGFTVIRKGYDDGDISARSIRLAVEAFGDHPAVAPLLLWWNNLPAPRRGRKVPRAGTQRKYKARARGNTAFVVSVPVNSLGVKDNESVMVRFETDRIEIRRA